MSLDAAKAVNLTQIAERLPHPAGTPPTIRILERGTYGPVFEVMACTGAESWPEEAGDSDAIYIVMSGEGRLWCGCESIECAAGDVLFTPAGMRRRFEALSRGFATWRVLLGTS